MSKRCCAKLCFNSQVTNRKVQYFGFPKYFHIAKEWAIAAGREDLLEKKISSLIKYYLCSEHFTDDCFLDPPYNTRLKKILRPVVWLPVPTIFCSNIDKYIVDKKNSIESVSESDYIQEDFTYETINDVNLNDSQCQDLSNLVDFRNNDSLPQIDVCDNTFSNLIVEQCSDSSQLFRDDCYYESESLNRNENHCRLCISLIPNDELILISAISEFEDKLQRLLPDMISINDKLPQHVCRACAEKIENCFVTIYNFERIQLELRRNI